GRKDAKTAGSTMTISAITLGAIIVSFAVLIIIFLDSLLDSLGAMGESKIHARMYLIILLPFAPFFCASTFLSALLRSEGRAGRALSILMLGNLLNIAFDALFILILNEGIAGAALATGLGHLGATLLGLYYLLKKSQIRAASPSPSLLKQVVPLGLPSLVRQLGTGSVIALVNSLLISHAGSDAVAAYTIINQITMLCYLPLSALVMGFAPIAGYAYGAGDRKRLQEAYRITLTSELLFGLTIMVLLQIFARPLLFIFTADDKVITQALNPLRVLLSTTAFVGIHTLGASYFQSIGKSLASLLLYMSRQFFLLIPLVILFSSYYGILGIWMAFPISDTLSAFFAFRLSRKDLHTL
ncbi:MAG: MATE family efflux transporter, partial [Spirochaetia bacterium]|nr:MATE family efflux transporter [Spirochaetia bacterium]